VASIATPPHGSFDPAAFMMSSPQVQVTWS
jgi:hypothetical protein